MKAVCPEEADGVPKVKAVYAEEAAKRIRMTSFE